MEMEVVNRSRELDRLATFANWKTSISEGRPSPLTLARLGYIYGGRDDVTVCIHCNSEVDRPVRRHRSCMSSVDVNNEDITTVLDRIRDAVNSKYNYSTNSVAAAGVNKDVLDNCTASQATRSSSQADSESSFLASCIQTIERAGRKDLSISDNDVQDTEVQIPEINRSNPDYEILQRDVNARLSTFQDWPVGSIISSTELADAGLFFTGQDDRVQCAFCHGYLRHWEQGDVAIEEHRRHFPDCPFLRNNRDIVDARLALNSMSSSATEPSTSSTTVTRPATSVAATVPMSRSRPKHPEFAQFHHRVQSFRRRRVPAGQSVDVLALAGFYYVGPTDNVRCFYCDGGLKHWQPTDDPWTEHRRHFPQCHYVIQHGQLPPTVETLRNPSYPNVARNAMSESSASNSVQFRVEPREIKARLDSPVVRSVIEMGYPRDIIRKAIEKRLTSMGDDYPNVTSMLEVVLELQEERDNVDDNRITSVGSTASTQPILRDVRAVAMSLPAAAIRRDGHSTNDVVPKTGVSTSNGMASVTSHPNPTAIVPSTGAHTVDVSAQLLEEENKKLKESRSCRICFDADINTVFLPCGHLVCCDSCAKSVSTCPICRTVIRGTVKTFFS